MTKSIFSALGYAVLDCSDGVYTLRSTTDQRVYVALIYAPGLSASTKTVKVLRYEVPAAADLEGVVDSWKTMDARRMGDDVDVFDFTLPVSAAPTGEVAELSYLRPDGDRLRYAGRLPTGDIICFN